MTHLKTLLATAAVLLTCALPAHSEELLSVRATVCDPPEDVVYLYQKLMADGAIIKIPDMRHRQTKSCSSFARASTTTFKPLSKFMVFVCGPQMNQLNAIGQYPGLCT